MRSPVYLCMFDVPKIGTKKYGARQLSYAAVILWEEHVDDFKKGLKKYLFKEYFYFGTQPV